MNKSESNQDLLRANREKFERVEKIEVSPLISRPRESSNLKSPDELNPKWITDPEEIRAEKRSAARELKKNEIRGNNGRTS